MLETLSKSEVQIKDNTNSFFICRVQMYDVRFNSISKLKSGQLSVSSLTLDHSEKIDLMTF